MKAHTAVRVLKSRNRTKTRLPQDWEINSAPIVQATNVTLPFRGIQVTSFASIKHEQYFCTLLKVLFFQLFISVH